MNIDTFKLRKQYARLRGIKDICTSQPFIHRGVGEDYNNLVSEISETIGEDLRSYLLPLTFFSSRNANLYSDFRYDVEDVNEKLLQLLSYLELGFGLTDKSITIGSIYNSISDPELKSRCSDILSSPDNFDRVINQASLVLEDRIRTKSGLSGLMGVDLVNKAINTELSKSPIKISDDTKEHEGISHICRGIVLSFRNPTHHRIIKSYSREDALKFCAFIDLLLKMLEQEDTGKQ